MIINLDDPRLQRKSMPDGMLNLDITEIPELALVHYPITVNARIFDGNDLLRLNLLYSILLEKFNGNVDKLSLNLRYLSAQRMDRPISPDHPFTLECYLNLIPHFKTIGIQCPHSNVFLDSLNRNKYIYQTIEVRKDLEKDFFTWAMISHIVTIPLNTMSLVIPDKGALERFQDIIAMWNGNIVICGKVRNPVDGKLSGFEIIQGTPTKNCLIIDDLCDGGGTFSGQSKILREAGAKTVGLAVYHGVFSKGLPIEGIDIVYTTNSVKDRESTDYLKVYSCS